MRVFYASDEPFLVEPYPERDWTADDRLDAEPRFSDRAQSGLGGGWCSVGWGTSHCHTAAEFVSILHLGPAQSRPGLSRLTPTRFTFLFEIVFQWRKLVEVSLARSRAR